MLFMFQKCDEFLPIRRDLDRSHEKGILSGIASDFRHPSSARHFTLRFQRDIGRVVGCRITLR